MKIECRRCDKLIDDKKIFCKQQSYEGMVGYCKECFSEVE